MVRQRIVDAAGVLFSRNGYRNTTVRAICQSAGVNVAAVNYHFGGKQELYEEVLKHSLCIAKGEHESDAALEEIAGISDPREALRATLRMILQRSLGFDASAWQERMMVHELAEPSPVLAGVVTHSIQPRYRILCGIVGKLLSLPARHPKTRLCAHSIIGQALHFVHAKPVIQVLWPEFRYTPEGIEATADHIAEFCLHAIDCIGKEHGRRKKR